MVCLPVGAGFKPARSPCRFCRRVGAKNFSPLRTMIVGILSLLFVHYSLFIVRWATTPPFGHPSKGGELKDIELFSKRYRTF
jgi:hypothetical protein